MRSAMIDGTSYREQSVMDCARLRVILGFARSDELDQWLRGKTAVPNKGSVHIEHGVQQIFIMAGEDLQVGTLATDDRNFRVPPAHVAHAILHGEHARQRCNI